MSTPEKRNPAGRPGFGVAGKGFRHNSESDYNPYAAAAAKAFAKEISIIMLAADRMAAGHTLAWPDFDRLHQAHQHIIGVLADMTGREVLQ